MWYDDRDQETKDRMMAMIPAMDQEGLSVEWPRMMEKLHPRSHLRRAWPVANKCPRPTSVKELPKYARMIPVLMSKGFTHGQIAKRYGVSRSRISQVYLDWKRLNLEGKD